MIGVIGCGNMAQAIVNGYHQKDSKVKFMTYTPSFTRADELARAVKGKAVKELSELTIAKTIVLACKPQQLNDLSHMVKNSDLNLKEKHIISILAATPIEALKNKLGAQKISRVMPNTPALIGEGVSLVIHSKEVTHKDKELVNKFFSACGEVQELKTEELFEKVTTVSGSGPAYVFLFAEALLTKLLNWGLNQEQARNIVNQLFIGSSHLMKNQKQDSLNEMIDKVTSKGGVTIEAINAFKKVGLSDITSSALDQAYARSMEIEREIKS